MADFTYSGAAHAPEQAYSTQSQRSKARPVAGMASWLGAAASLALMAGIGIWSYQVLSRDVSGVPVVQAMSGPMRVAPENPGGDLAAHQGLAVNTVAAQSEAEEPADRLMLAPRPAGLGEDDVAQGALAGQATISQPAQLTVEASLTDTDEAGDPILALADQLASGAETLSQTPAQKPADAQQSELAALLADVQAKATQQPQEVAVTVPKQGLGRSLRPKTRPAGVQTASLNTAPAPAAAAPGSVEVDPATLTAGTRLVQIGAFDSPEVARSEWTRLEARFGDYLEGKARVIQKATSGGRTFYRLRAHGFDNLADARRFCAAFVAQNVDCIPVVTR